MNDELSRRNLVEMKMLLPLMADRQSWSKLSNFEFVIFFFFPFCCCYCLSKNAQIIISNGKRQPRWKNHESVYRNKNLEHGQQQKMSQSTEKQQNMWRKTRISVCTCVHGTVSLAWYGYECGLYSMWCTMAIVCELHWMATALVESRQDVENRFLNIYMRSSILIKYFVYRQEGCGTWWLVRYWSLVANVLLFECIFFHILLRCPVRMYANSVGLSNLFEDFSFHKATYQRARPSRIHSPTNYVYILATK